MLRVHVQTRTQSLRVQVCTRECECSHSQVCEYIIASASASTSTREYGCSRLRVVALALASESARARE